MKKPKTALENARIVEVKIKSIKRAGNEDVYCLAAQNNGTMIANGIITKNCDALRYCMATHKISTYKPYKEERRNDEWNSNRFEPTMSKRY